MAPRSESPPKPSPSVPLGRGGMTLILQGLVYRGLGEDAGALDPF